MNEQEIKLPELPTLAGLEIAITFGPGYIGKLMQSYASQAVRMNQQCPEMGTPERRPFDLEAAKRGEHVMWGGELVRWVGLSEGVNPRFPNIIEHEGGLSYASDKELSMAPKPKRTVWANTYYHDTKESALMRGKWAALVAVPVEIEE